MLQSSFRFKDNPHNWEELIFYVSIDKLLYFLNSVNNPNQRIQESPDLYSRALFPKIEKGNCFSIDYLTVFWKKHQGKLPPLHVYLGSPPFDEAKPAIEENYETLQLAQLTGAASLPVIFSGQIDLACEAGLISENQFDQFKAFLNSLD